MAVLTEAFPTFAALVRLLSCMDSLMPNEVRTSAKAFPTLLALRRFFQFGDWLVATERALRAVSPTRDTRTGLLAGMESLLTPPVLGRGSPRTLPWRTSSLPFGLRLTLLASLGLRVPKNFTTLSPYGLLHFCLP